jgi:hypothetical protein
MSNWIKLLHQFESIFKTEGKKSRETAPLRVGFHSEFELFQGCYLLQLNFWINFKDEIVKETLSKVELRTEFNPSHVKSEVTT